jgi:Ankyrin repeats (3 copies)
MDGFLPLHVAVKHASLEVIEIHVDSCPHALLEGCDNKGWLPMHVAVQEASLEVVQNLIKTCSVSSRSRTAEGASRCTLPSSTRR